MSVKIMTRVWEAAFPTLSMKLVALKLADCANDDGENIYPSAERVERETGVSLSGVREVLADMEAAGLLIVVQEGSGNRFGRSTTIRRFDLPSLVALADGKIVWEQTARAVRDPVTGALKTDPKTGQAKMRKVWRLIEAPSAVVTPPAVGGAGEKPPLQPLEGTPPTVGPHPSNRQAFAPPMVGPKPSIEPSIEPSLHAPDGARGCERLAVAFSRGWDKHARAELDEVRRSATRGHVVPMFFDEVCGTLSPPRSADGAAYVRQAAKRLHPFQPDVLAAVAQQMLDERGQNLPAAFELEEAAKAITAKREAERAALALGSAMVGLGGNGAAVAFPDPGEIVEALWAAAAERLKKRRGLDVFKSWFEPLRPLRRNGGVLVLWAEKAFVARWVQQNYEADVLAAVSAENREITSVKFTSGAQALIAVEKPATGVAA